jgi:hypothetical protein
VNGPVLSLLQLSPGEATAAGLLTQFEADHPGVRIIVPHYQDEPWRAVITEGGVPGGGPHTSSVIGAEWPTGLLGKLERLFGGGQAEPG